MYVKKSMSSVVGLFVALILLLSSSVSLVHAELISDQQVDEQKKVVMLALVETLREDVKLLQMILIQRIEARVTYLQTLATNQ
jgi:Na+-transporting NADH:ubiquinone oxidoreductase subunit NqrC